MHDVLGTESVPLFWFLDIMYIQVKSVLRVRSHLCTNKRHDGPLFPTHNTREHSCKCQIVKILDYITIKIQWLMASGWKFMKGRYCMDIK